MSSNEEEQQLYEFVSYIELQGMQCGLNHGYDLNKNPNAVDYLCQQLGDQHSGISDAMLRIPVCIECLTALHDPDYVLLFCVSCTSSQWIYRPTSKRDYGDTKIMFLSYCPKCMNK